MTVIVDKFIVADIHLLQNLAIQNTFKVIVNWSF